MMAVGEEMLVLYADTQITVYEKAIYLNTCDPT
jgi:hypothetical protein